MGQLFEWIKKWFDKLDFIVSKIITKIRWRNNGVTSINQIKHLCCHNVMLKNHALYFVVKHLMKI